jgi:hypothetical protein
MIRWIKKWIRKIKESKKPQLEYNVEGVRQRLREESHYYTRGTTPEWEVMIAENLMKNINPQLFPLLERWVTHRQHLNFNFQGATLYDLMQYGRFPYIDALVRMSTFMEEPDLAEHWVRRLEENIVGYERK